CSSHLPPPVSTLPSWTLTLWNQIYEHISSHECWSQKTRKALLQLTVPDEKMYLSASSFS
ncbi:hypothetical protein LEMLEM_LOCUS7664, partial [Lemmus lemmus]